MLKAVLSVSSLAIQAVKTVPLGLAVQVGGEVGSRGWSGFALRHHSYRQPPADGVYEADMVGIPPRAPGPEAVTPFSHEDIWAPFPDAHLKGLKVHSATNSMTAMLK